MTSPSEAAAITRLLLETLDWRAFSPKLVAALVDRGSTFRFKQDVQRGNGDLPPMLNLPLMVSALVISSSLCQNQQKSSFATLYTNYFFLLSFFVLASSHWCVSTQSTHFNALLMWHPLTLQLAPHTHPSSLNTSMPFVLLSYCYF